MTNLEYFENKHTSLSDAFKDAMKEFKNSGYENFSEFLQSDRNKFKVGDIIVVDSKNRIAHYLGWSKNVVFKILEVDKCEAYKVKNLTPLNLTPIGEESWLRRDFIDEVCYLY